MGSLNGRTRQSSRFLCDEATPLVDILEADAADLVAKIIGLRTALDTASTIADRRRPRVLSVEEHAMMSMGRGVAIQQSDLEDGTPPEARVAVGKLTERLRPAVWARVGEAIVQAMPGRHETIEAKVKEFGRLMAGFRRRPEGRFRRSFRRGEMMRKFHELAEDDPVFTRSAAITVGSMARALADSKTALASTRDLEDRVDDVDQLLDDVMKSSAVITECLKTLAAKDKAFDDEIAKLRAAPDVLQKMAVWERGFFERQWAAEVKKGHTRVDFEDYLAGIEARRAEMRKRDERDDYDDGEAISTARFNAQYRVL